MRGLFRNVTPEEHKRSSPAKVEIVVSLPKWGYFVWTTTATAPRLGLLVRGFAFILVSSDILDPA